MSMVNENRPGYKKTKVGWIPEEWECNKARHYFNKGIQKGKQNLPLYSVTINNGLVRRDTIDRKFDSKLTNEQCLLVDKNNLAYNMMRMWQGAVGLSEEPCLVSPAYVVLKPNLTIHPKYAFYLLKSRRYIHWLKSYSYGLTKDRLRLYYNDFSIIPFPKPSFPEQKKISEILSTWDVVIEKLEKLIELKEKRKKGLMQQLLTGKKRLPGFGKAVEKDGEVPKGWNTYELERITNVAFSNVDKKTYSDQQFVKLCNYTDVYKNNYITRSMNFMASTASDSEILKFRLQKDDVIITKDSETPNDIGVPTVVLEDMDNVICGYHLALIRPKKQILDGIFLSKKFNESHIRYRFSTLANGATRFGLSTSSIKQMRITIPSKAEQIAIREILFLDDQIITKLKDKINKLEIQKKGLMQKLLTGEVRVKI